MPTDSPQEHDRTAIEVAEHCPLSDDARLSLNPDLAPGSYVALLISRKKYADAIRFTAFNLTKREAVWWGTLCLWEAHREKPIAKPMCRVFETLIAWLQDPSETNRRAVETAGRNAGIATPHGQLAMAAFFSEGSVSLPDQPNVTPEPWLTAKNVASAVLAASKIGRPSDVAASQRLFLVLAAELTRGQLPWTATDKLEPANSTT